MKSGRWRTAALSVAAAAALAAVLLAGLAGTANAKDIIVDTCSVTNQDSCSVSGTFPDPNYIVVSVVDLPQIADEPVVLNWTMDCDGVSQTGTTHAALPEPQQGDGLVQMMPFTVSNPSSCSMEVTAFVPPQQNSYSLTVEAEYLPNPPTASPSPSGSPQADVSHLVRGAQGICLSDAGNSAAVRTAVVIAKCSPSAADQHWTYAGRELRIHQDMCANAKGGGASGGKVLLWRCTGAANEIWTHKADGEYVLKAGRSVMCLDDPRSSAKSGTQLIVYRCADTSNQRWGLP